MHLYQKIVVMVAVVVVGCKAQNRAETAAPAGAPPTPTAAEPAAAASAPKAEAAQAAPPAPAGGSAQAKVAVAAPTADRDEAAADSNWDPKKAYAQAGVAAPGAAEQLGQP
ncbi:MAG: hypothetical protein HY902_18625, partial [Deltaproteobacteria bacterium]|nr:hypothetical protein [Deltaproteobacteria bacterium]